LPGDDGGDDDRDADDPELAAVRGVRLAMRRQETPGIGPAELLAAAPAKAAAIQLRPAWRALRVVRSM
jgi:hypothetical protein